VNVFPFADLLADLRRRGFGIGLHEYNDVAKLAERWKGVDRESFRDALAGVLARNADEVERIREIFDDWVDAEPPPAPPPPPPQPKVRTWHVVAIVLLVAAIGGAAAWRIYDKRHEEKPAIT
jgi:uncharacterized protein with von Willebrand factor type A (vWA) domain